MSSIHASPLAVDPLLRRVEAWLAEGKLDDADLDAALGADARACVDLGGPARDWMPLAVGESLLSLVAGPLGGETGLADWAGEVVQDWLEREDLRALRVQAAGLVDGPGFLAAQTSERLLRPAAWRYEGGADRFRVSLEGLGPVSAELRVFLGALIARFVERVWEGFDVRFRGVDEGDLVVFGERVGERGPEGDRGRHQLHRAALVPAE